jgi:hypothetical protein
VAPPAHPASSCRVPAGPRWRTADLAAAAADEPALEDGGNASCLAFVAAPTLPSFEEGADMPKVSKHSTAPRQDGGPGTEWRGDLDGYTCSFVALEADADLTPLLQGLPGDQCPSPHWGYVFEGSMWWRHGDREETFGPGDAFYVEPGHTAGAAAGSEFVMFSPCEVMAEVEAHMMGRARELQSAPRT